MQANQDVLPQSKQNRIALVARPWVDDRSPCDGTAWGVSVIVVGIGYVFMGVTNATSQKAKNKH